jgi:hypothetical protein
MPKKSQYCSPGINGEWPLQTLRAMPKAVSDWNTTNLAPLRPEEQVAFVAANSQTGASAVDLITFPGLVQAASLRGWASTWDDNPTRAEADSCPATDLF